MSTITITDLRKHIADVVTRVEQGERILILRRGKPVAEMAPLSQPSSDLPTWKQPFTPLAIPGVSLSEVILKERAEENESGD